MDWQFLFALVIVASAAAYLARRAWRTWPGRYTSGCSEGCGCAQAPAAREEQATLIPVEQIRLRKRFDQGDRSA